jgi:Flp pilus assembly protein TadB
MRNKRERNDINAYRYNARDYLLLADTLIQESLQTVVHDLESKMRQLGSYAGMAVMMAVLLSYWSLSTGLIVAVAAVLPLFIWSFRLSRKCSAIRDFMAWLYIDFENRLDDMCAAAFSQNEIGKGDQ